jgi:hypothetical protein
MSAKNYFASSKNQIFNDPVVHLFSQLGGNTIAFRLTIQLHQKMVQSGIATWATLKKSGELWTYLQKVS